MIYVDDVKIFSIVQSPEDAACLQPDQDALIAWSNENGLELNIKKCNVISFTKGRNPPLFNYFIKGKMLERVNVIKDLGVIFDSAVTFTPHIDYVTAKSARRLSFIKRTTVDFTSTTAITHLYKCLILPNYFYCSQIWSPFTNNQTNRLEYCRYNLLRYLSYKANSPMNIFDHNYTDIIAFSTSKYKVHSRFP